MINKILIMAIMVHFAIQSFGQIQLNSSGNVGIGIAPSSYKLYTNGTVRLKQGSATLYLRNNQIQLCHNESNSDLFFDAYEEEEPNLYPEDDDCGGLGTSTKQYWEVWGRYIYAYSFILTSDIRLKENIRPLSNSINKIMSIRGVKYDFITPKDVSWNENKLNKFEYLGKNKIGFIAQELIEVCPELVKYNDKNDEYSIDYLGMIPILVEAIKEQQTFIEELKSEISKFKSESSLKSSIANNDNISEEGDKPILYQNKPNPFFENTLIRFYIPRHSQKATIYIYDLQGLQKKAFYINEKGDSSITINGFELQPGTYLYNLIVDGIEVDMKRMILTK